MVGKKDGVVAKLKRRCISTHCMNHQLHLAVSKAFNSLTAIDNTGELLSDIIKYYNFSTVRSESLNAIQTLLRDMDQLGTAAY